MKLARGIFEVLFGVLCLVAVALFATGTMDPPAGQTVSTGRYIFGTVLGIASLIVGFVDIKGAFSKPEEEKQETEEKRDTAN